MLDDQTENMCRQLLDVASVAPDETSQQTKFCASNLGRLRIFDQKLRNAIFSPSDRDFLGLDETLLKSTDEFDGQVKICHTLASWL